MKTHDGNVGKICADVGKLTIDTWKNSIYHMMNFILVNHTRIFI